MLIAEVAGGRQFECLITNDRELQRLNREFLRQDYPTDVLSFPSGTAGGFAGEMAISVERAAEQAAEFGHTLSEEIKILMLHGVLHLLGMDHEKDRGVMARAEKRWRTHFSLPASLTERVRG
jgi:probable rRNA maturation factor